MSLKRIVGHLILGAGISFPFIILPIVIFSGERHALSPAAVFIGGGGLTFLIYMIGTASAEQLINSPNMQLISFTPITPRRIFIQALRRHAVLVLVFWILNPVLILLLVHTRLYWEARTALAGPAQPLHPLAGVNCALTYELLLIYPLFLRLTDHPWRWNFFFFARRALIHLAFALISVVSLTWRVSIWLGWASLLALGGTIWVYRVEIIMALYRLLLDLVGMGGIGHAILYAFAPMAGLAYLSRPEAASALPPMLTALLSGLLLICVGKVVRVCSARTMEHDQEQTDWWMEHRDEVEELEEAEIRDLNAAHPAPWVGNAMAEEIAEDKAGGTADNAHQLEYRTDLDAAGQIWRHQRYWRGAGGWMSINPAFVIIAVVLAASLARVDVSGKNIQAMKYIPFALATIFMLIHQAVRTSHHLGALADWGCIIPVKWPRAVLRHAFWDDRRRLITDLIWVLLFFLCLGGRGEILLIIPPVLVVNRLALGLLYWISARATIGSRMPRWLLGIPYIFICVMVVIMMFVNIGEIADSAAKPDHDGFLVCMIGFGCWLLVFSIIPGLLILGWQRLWSDFQIMAKPGYRTFEVTVDKN